MDFQIYICQNADLNHYNQRVLLIQKEYDSFENWLDINDGKSLGEWIQLFKKTFKFTGNEITNEFLMSIGYLPGAHHIECPIYKLIEKLVPPWTRANESF